MAWSFSTGVFLRRVVNLDALLARFLFCFDSRLSLIVWSALDSSEAGYSSLVCCF